MSTKNVTTSTNQYNPGSMSAYHTLQPIAGNYLAGQMQGGANSPFMTAANRVSLPISGAMPGITGANVQNNNVALGTGMNTGINSYMGRTAGYGSAAFGSNLNNSLLLGNQQLRLGAMQSAMGYRPLQTGGRQVSALTGPGTWLTPMAGLAAAGAMGFANQNGNPGIQQRQDEVNWASNYDAQNDLTDNFSRAPGDSVWGFNSSGNN